MSHNTKIIIYQRMDYAYAVVTAIAANEDPALAVKLITSVEEILAAMVTRSHSHSHSHSH